MRVVHDLTCARRSGAPRSARAHARRSRPPARRRRTTRGARRARAPGRRARRPLLDQRRRRGAARGRRSPCRSRSRSGLAQLAAGGVEHDPQGVQRPRRRRRRQPADSMSTASGAALRSASPARPPCTSRSLEAIGATCTRSPPRRSTPARIVGSSHGDGPVRAAQLAGEDDVARLEVGVERAAEAGDQTAAAARAIGSCARTGPRGAGPSRSAARRPRARRARTARASSDSGASTTITGAGLGPAAGSHGGRRGQLGAGRASALRGPATFGSDARGAVVAIARSPLEQRGRCGPRPPSLPASRCRSRRRPAPAPARRSTARSQRPRPGGRAERRGVVTGDEELANGRHRAAAGSSSASAGR